MSKSFWKGVLASYLAIALVGGFAMKTVIPALNPLGIAYTGLTWPIGVTCVALQPYTECSAIPPQNYAELLFTFEDPAP